MVSSKRSPRSRPAAPERRYAKGAPASVSPHGFDVLAARSALSTLAPPVLLLNHGCGWRHELAVDRVSVVELAALMAAHRDLGCEA